MNKNDNKLKSKRNINAVLLLNKPKGITSNAALQKVKHLFLATKAGHTGSLDPLATGMLAICFGEMTKFSQFLLDSDKRYFVVVRLGIKTTTGDTEGEVVEKRTVKNISTAQLNNILDNFRGEISQVPSMFSAIKYQGEPLYKLARQGISVERNVRIVKIYDLLLLEHTHDSITLDIFCSKGTYIRTLVEDIGEKLGCGAHITSLHRSSLSTMQENQMITLEQIEQATLEERDQMLLSSNSILENWPKLNLSMASAYYLLRGQPIIIPHAPSEGWVRLFLNADKFIGVGKILSDGRVAPKRLVTNTSNASTK